MMSVTECPHCCRKVILSQDGECPSCGKKESEAHPSGKPMRLLAVRGGDKFPSICFSCGAPANRFVAVTQSNVDVETSIRRALFRIFVPFGGLFSAFESAKHDKSFSLKLPICEKCRKQKIKPEVQSFDLESREVRLVVHEKFRDNVSRKENVSDNQIK
jgi:hypothetical protein